MIEEETVPVLLNCPCACSDGDEIPVRRLSHFFGRLKRAGGKRLSSVQVFIELFSKVKKN